MQRYILILILPVLAAFGAMAQDGFFDDEEPVDGRWMVSFGLGGNSSGYECELACSWWPVENFGFKGALGLAGEVGDVHLYDYYDDYYYEDDPRASRFKFMPSVEMRSPRLLQWRDGINCLRLFANPGCCLSPGASGSHKAKWFNWQLRGGIEADFGEASVQLGYGYSDFNLYSGNPYNYNGSEHDGAAYTHSIFVNFGIRF